MRRYIKQVCIIQRERECMRVCGERKRSLATFIWHRTHHAQHTLLTAVVRYLILFCKPLSNPECIPRIRVRSQLRYHSNQFIHMTTYRDSRYPLSLFSIHCRFSGMKREDLPGLFSSRFKARFAAMARRGGKDAEQQYPCADRRYTTKVSYTNRLTETGKYSFQKFSLPLSRPNAYSFYSYGGFYTIFHLMVLHKGTAATKSTDRPQRCLQRTYKHVDVIHLQ